MKLRNEYTITEGEIKCGELSCKILFALVFNDDGVFYIETFLPNEQFYEQTENTTFYRLVGKTEKGYDNDKLYFISFATVYFLPPKSFRRG